MNDQFNQYVSALITTARATVGIQDAFALKKLHHRMVGLASAYSSFRMTNAVPELQQLRSQITALLDLIEYEEHLKRGNQLLLAQSKRALLKFDLTCRKPLIPAAKKTTEKTESAKLAAPLNENKKNILQFIKRSPARAKDIVDEFTVLSPRTVKRSLRELMNNGLIKKSAKNHTTIYTALE